MRARRNLWTVLAAVIAMVMMASAQEPKKEIKHVPITATSPASGQEMYKTYCAVCHGTDAKGNGPAAGGPEGSPDNPPPFAGRMEASIQQ
jgi:mono/diheme cytochrome c family protein